MTDLTPQMLINRLDELLEEERDTLLRGELAAMAGLSEQKEALIDLLNAMEPQRPGTLADLQNKVERNRVLLDGALEGIRKVATRLAALRHARRTLETYDAKGEKHSYQGAVEHRLEKRA